MENENLTGDRWKLLILNPENAYFLSARICFWIYFDIRELYENQWVKHKIKF